MSPLAEGSSPQEEPTSSDPAVSSTPESYEAGDVQPRGHEDRVEPTPEPAPAEEEKRRYPSTIGGACYLAVLAVTLVGLVVVGAGHWRGGLHCIAAALLAAAVLRFVLPQRDAGMLAVRTRWIDCTLLGALGVLLWVLATTTPNV